MKINTQKKSYVAYIKNVIVPVAFLSGLVGVISGLIVSLYNALARFLTKNSKSIYLFVREKPAFIPLLFLGLTILAFFVTFLLKKTPEVKGSGIPQTEGTLRGLFSFNWLKMLINTIVITSVAFFSGMSLGAEGPSIQIGATSAQGVSDTIKRNVAWRRYIITGGASSGIAVAFNAPLTGIIFAIEEAHKRFTPMIMLSATIAVTFATIISNTLGVFWGDGGLFFKVALIDIPLSFFWVFIIIGVVAGLASVLFNFVFVNLKKKLDDSKKIPLWSKILSAFLLTGIVGLLLTNSLGGGHSLILNIVKEDFSAGMLLLLLVVKLVLMLVCFTSGVTGGLFIPMLAIGSLIGGLLGKLFMVLGMPPEYYATTVFICMMAFFAGSVRAPLTAVVLLLESTGFYTSFLITSIAVFIAFLVAELCGSIPFYESLIHLISKNRHKNQKQYICDYKVKVQPESFAVKKTVRDILWPANCLIVLLHNDIDGEIVPDGETILHQNDILNIRVETYDSEDTTNQLLAILGAQNYFKIETEILPVSHNENNAKSLKKDYIEYSKNHDIKLKKEDKNENN